MILKQGQSLLLFRSCLLCLALLFSFESCTPVSESSTSPPLTQSPRLLSLHPAITETLYALGAHKMLTGRSTYCSFPKEAKALPEFGTSLTPNYEAIANHRPTLILTDQSLGTPIKALSRIATVSQFPWLTLEDMTLSIDRLGKQVKQEKKAQELIHLLQVGLKSTSTPQSPTALVLMEGSVPSKGQLWFIRHDSLHGAALEAAGFRNAAPTSFKGPPSMSIETLLRQNPDYIFLLVAQPINTQSAQNWIESFQVLPALKAVKKQQIGVLNGHHLLGVGPKVLDLVDIIRTTAQRLGKMSTRQHLPK